MMSVKIAPLICVLVLHYLPAVLPRTITAKSQHLCDLFNYNPPSLVAIRIGIKATPGRSLSRTHCISTLVPLRGGGRGMGSEASNGTQVPAVPAEAVGVLSSEGLQLRRVNWQDDKSNGLGSSAAIPQPTMGNDHSTLGADGTGEEEDDSFASLDTSENGDAQANGEAAETTPAQEKLWMACKSGDDAHIYRLVRVEGADVNARDPAFGLWTACHYAAQAGSSRVVEALWRLGADINTLNGAGAAPLCLAAAEGHVSLIQKLVSKGADANATNVYGRCPTYPSTSNMIAHK